MITEVVPSQYHTAILQAQELSHRASQPQLPAGTREQFTDKT